MNPIMFKAIEDGTEEPTETRVSLRNGGHAAALELSGLVSLGDFGGIFNWAKAAARQVGAATKTVPGHLTPVRKAGGIAAQPWERLRVNAPPVITGKRTSPAPTIADRVGAALDRQHGAAIAARSPKALVRAASQDPIGDEAGTDEVEAVAQWLSGLSGVNRHALGGLFNVEAPDAAYYALEQTARASGLGSLGDLYDLAAQGRVDAALDGALGGWLKKLVRKSSSAVKAVVKPVARVATTVTMPVARVVARPVTRAATAVVRATPSVMGRAAGTVIKAVQKVGTTAARATTTAARGVARGTTAIVKPVARPVVKATKFVGRRAGTVAKVVAAPVLIPATAAASAGAALLARRGSAQETVVEAESPAAQAATTAVEPAPSPASAPPPTQFTPPPTAPQYAMPQYGIPTEWSPAQTFRPQEPPPAYSQPAPPDWTSYTPAEEEAAPPETEEYAEQPDGAEQAAYTSAETTEADGGLPPEYAEPPPEGEPPPEYAEPDVVQAPEYAEPLPEEGYDYQSAFYESGYMQGLGYLLGETDPVRIRAKERNMARSDPGYMDPKVLFSASGAAKLGVTAAKAATAAKLHQSRAKVIENRVRRLAEEGKRERDANRKNQLAAEALDWSRRLFMEHAAASRAATIAGGLQVALEHRKAADGAISESGAKSSLGKAASALVQTQAFAKTPVRVELPDLLSQGYIEKMRTGVALSGLDDFAGTAARIMRAGQRKPVGPSDLTQSAKVMAQIGRRTPAPWPRAGSAVPAHLRARNAPTPKYAHPTFKAGIPGLNMPAAMFQAQYGMDDQNPGFEASLYGLDVVNVPETFDGGLGGLDGALDFLQSIGDVAKQVTSPKTVLGKFLNKDYTGATADGLKFSAGILTRPGAQPPTAPSAPEEREVLNQISDRSSSILSTTGGKIGLVAVAGGFGLLVVLLARRRRA